MLYEISIGRERSRLLFRSMVRRVNEIREQPEFYNTLTDNCTTGIGRHAERLSLFDKYLNYKIVLPGVFGRVGVQDWGDPQPPPLAEVRARATVDPNTTTLDDPDFSKKIRGIGQTD